MGKDDDDEKSSAFVFIKDPDYAWRPAVLEETKGDKAIVSVPEYKDEAAMTCDGGRGAKRKEERTIDLKKYAHKVLPLQNVDNVGQMLLFADMVKLPYLHEAGILFNLKARHMEGHPYTRTGDIIIAVNPFQWFTHLYTEEKRVYYSNRLVWEDHESDPRDGMDPHVYEVSSLCYKGLAFGMVDQSILVSGESGAGKTETVKIAMNHMASVQKGPVSDGDSNELDPVVKRVVDSNPLLEAFGNASTVRNDNSSRFGKYLQLQFDQTEAKAGAVTKSKSTTTLAGSKCDVYLLEKNRVTGHESKERTYHIFYQLCAAPDEEKSKYWSKLKGKKRSDFKYVGDCIEKKIEGMTDEENFFHTKKTLELIKVREGDKLDILLRAVAIVMQSGNLTFGPLKGDSDKSEITSKAACDDLAGLMEVSDKDLNLAFTERTMKTKNETYKVPLKPDAAKDACDAFAKEVYGKLFLWLVKEINAATCAEDNYKDGSMTDFGIIGMLDIFGFESFVVNRFEQLCINYANEKLQQKFTEDVFRAVQDEYQAEGIALDQITYDDNTDVLDLIESRTGLCAMLNEECVRPKGNDQAFVQKALAANKKSPCLIVNMHDRMSFGIHHYAGKVMYDADGFVVRNTDSIPPDLDEIMTKASNEIVSKPPADSAAAAPTKAPKRAKSNLAGSTVWNKYKVQLASLMGNLQKTSSRYIRCVKPNMAKVPNVMEHTPTVEQLRCAGVVAAVTLARSAFPNRLDNASCRFRFASMWDRGAYPSKKSDSMPKEEQLKWDCEAILTSALQDKKYKDKEGNLRLPFAVGNTRSYFKAGALEFLEANRSNNLDKYAVTIQRFGRGLIARQRYDDMVGAAKRAEKEAAEKAERAAREAAEAAEREAREAKEKAEAEARERQAKRDADRKKYTGKADELKKKLKEADEDFEKTMADVKERKAKAEEEIEDLTEKTSDKSRKDMMAPKKLAAQQKKKLAEQTKLIEFLKKENKKIRKEHDKMKTKYDAVKENNDRLIQQAEEAGDDFDNVNDEAGNACDKNDDLQTQLENAKKDNKSLKEKCMQRQDEYMAQAETRLEYQKTMARILNLIQDTSKERQVIEDTVVIALECESESKSIMAALEAEVED